MTTQTPEKSVAAQKAAEDLKTALARLRTEDGWKAWLQSKAKLHRHSTMNQLLIWSQFPDASICRGKRQWENDFNRLLIARAQPIWIRAPRTKKLKELDENGEYQTRTYFKNVRVYDVSQTMRIPDLPEIPISPPTEPIEGESHRPWILRLKRLANAEGLEVLFETVRGTARGYYDQENSRIAVDWTLSANGQVRVLVHELCHAFGYQDYSDGRARTEACTEAAAFIACSMIGLDVSGESVAYIEGWYDEAETVIEADLKKIDAIARRVAAAGEDS